MRALQDELEKLSSIEDRGQTDSVTALPRAYAVHIALWPWHMTLTSSPRRAVVMMTHTQSHVGRSKDRVQTNGQTGRRYRLPSRLTRPVKIVLTDARYETSVAKSGSEFETINH